ncbi:cell division cycle-related protein [Rhizoctonia solani]
MNDETEGPPSFWVRAVYDYQSTDDSSLSFSRGDIVEVLGTLPSGWWDGLIGNERGWFPSNFVVTIPDSEAEAELAARGGAIDVDPANLESDSEWVQDELEHVADAAIPIDFAGARDDLWLPEVQPNGQIVYVNGAGQRRTDLPDADTDDMTPQPVTVSSPSGRPSRPRANTATTQSSVGGFGFVRRTGTPEPWIKRLTDDGHAFFYENTETGEIMWSRPEVARGISAQQSLASSASGLDLRARYRVAESAPEDEMDAAASTEDEDMGIIMPHSNTNRLSVYSDASEVNPRFDIDFPLPSSLPTATNQADTEPHIDPAEVQRRLAPPDLDTIEALAGVAKNAITAVSQCMQIPIQDHTQPHAPLVARVIIAVRNLLYVSGTLASAPEVLSPLLGEPAESRPDAHPPLAHLKQYQRKVTATLSKLVLSARAADSGEDDANARSRVAIDAGELERAVDRFVAEARDRPLTRTLRGVLSPTHIGKGAPGGGIAGQWRGSGFIERVAKALTPEACDEIRVLGQDLETNLVSVQQGVNNIREETGPDEIKPEDGVSTIITRGRAAITSLCAFLNAAEELDVAGKVGKDIETRRGLVRKSALEQQGLGRMKSRDGLRRAGSKDELRRVGRVGSRDQMRRMGSRDELRRIGSREELGRLSRPASRGKLSRMNSQEQFPHPPPPPPHMSRQASRDQLAPTLTSPLILSRPGSRDQLALSRSASRDKLTQSRPVSFNAKGRLDTSQDVRNAVRRLEVTKQALYDAGVTLLLASQTVHVAVLRSAGSAPAPAKVATRGVDTNALNLVSLSISTIRENQREMTDLLDALAKTDGPESYVSRETKRDTLMSSTNYSQSYRTTTDTDMYSRTDTYPSSIRSPVDDHLATLYGGDGSTFGDSIYGAEFGAGVGRDRVDSVGRDSRFDSIGRDSRFDSIGRDGLNDAPGSYGRAYPERGVWDKTRPGEKPRQPLKHLDSAVSLPQSDLSTESLGYAPQGQGNYSRSGTALGKTRPDSLDLLSDAESDVEKDGHGNRGPPRVNNKILKLLGDDAAAELARSGGAITPTPIVDTTPWYLKPTYNDPSQILFNTDGGVRGGTLPALVERLTMHDQMDSTFIDAFLMTYKSFTTIHELFQLLVERFRIQPPEGLAPAELDEWVEKKQKPVRVRVVNIFKKMLLDPSVIDKEDSSILNNIRSFASEIMRDVTPAEQLIMFVDRIQKQGDSLGRKYTVTTTSAVPTPLVPKSGKRLKLLDIDPLELARQLTLLESKQYNAIKPIECLARARDEPAENDSIKTIITTTNKIASWVAFSVLDKDEPRRRGNTIKHFIHVAERCRALHNYSTMAALIAGLNSPPIRRLKRTWDSVPAKITAILDDVEGTLDSGKNFTAYKQRLKTVDTACVPFLGVYLTVLTFIQDGNKDFISKEQGIINFGKRQKAAEVIREIQSYQAKQYQLAIVDQIQTFIEDSLGNVDEKADYWETSMLLEPREREDEKMTRMLQESGFL